MTRCIQCTRCVRFGLEIQGFPQLGTTGRGEHMQIETFVEQALDHELSANIIDLCPVGALNNKPFRYHARAWEMSQRPLVSPHDGFGTNIYAHVLRGKVMRVVPRENEEINETWIADRDRFGFEGMYSHERVSEPLVRVDGFLKSVDWEVALTAAGRACKKWPRSPEPRVSVFSPRPGDARGDVFARADRARSRLEQYRPSPASARHSRRRGGGCLSEPRHANRRGGIARGAVGGGLESASRNAPACAPHPQGGVARRCSGLLDPRRFEYLFPLAGYGWRRTSWAGSPPWCARPRPPRSARYRPASVRRPSTTFIARSRRLEPWRAARNFPRNPGAATSRLCRDQGARAHPGRALRATVGLVTEGANAAGAYLAGCVPHREPGGAPGPPRTAGACDARWPVQGYLLLGGSTRRTISLRRRGARWGVHRRRLEPPHREPRATGRSAAHRSVRQNLGTFVNVEGRWQSWAGAASPVGREPAGLEGAASPRGYADIPAVTT